MEMEQNIYSEKIKLVQIVNTRPGKIEQIGKLHAGRFLRGLFYFE